MVPLVTAATAVTAGTATAVMSVGSTPMDLDSVEGQVQMQKKAIAGAGAKSGGTVQPAVGAAQASRPSPGSGQTRNTVAIGSGMKGSVVDAPASAGGGDSASTAEAAETGGTGAGVKGQPGGVARRATRASVGGSGK
jgi:hypothetical protein